MSRTRLVVGGALLLVLCWFALPVVAQQGTESGLIKLTPGMMGQEEGAQTFLSKFISGTNFSGTIETGYTFNFNRTKDSAIASIIGENPGRIFDGRHNELMLNAVTLQIERGVDAENAVGFAITPVVGDDAGTVNGVSPTSDDVFGDDDLTLIDAYLSFRVPDEVMVLDGTVVKVGRFQTIFGSERLAGPLNDNYSRSILFGYAIPFTHTGVLAEKAIAMGDGEVAFRLGWVNGWDNIRDNNDSGNLLAGFKLAPADWFDLAFGASWGPEQTNSATESHANGDYRTLFDIVSTIRIPDAMSGDMDMLKSLKLLLNFDWGGEEGVTVSPGSTVYAQWYGFAGILRYDFGIGMLGSEEGQDNWYVAVRGEFFDDPDGTRLLAGTPAAGTAVQAWELTGTVGWFPFKPLLLRFEVRYDKADENIFEDAVKNHQTTLALSASVFF